MNSKRPSENNGPCMPPDPVSIPTRSKTICILTPHREPAFPHRKASLLSAKSDFARHDIPFRVSAWLTAVTLTWRAEHHPIRVGFPLRPLEGQELTHDALAEVHSVPLRKAI